MTCKNVSFDLNLMYSLMNAVLTFLDEIYKDTKAKMINLENAQSLWTLG